MLGVAVYPSAMKSVLHVLGGGGVVVVSLVLCVASAYSGSPGFLSFSDHAGRAMNISYTPRALLVDSVPSTFLSGSVHLPRIHPSLWEQTASDAVRHNLNMLEVYVFWNFHEPMEGQFNFDGAADLYKFVEGIGKAGLWVNLRIGPYVCAEYEYGGIPAWVGLKDGLLFRTNNTVWQSHMQSWFQRVVEKMVPLFAPNGGPIILVQVENELHGGESAEAQAYTEWCGDMAHAALAKANVSVPIVMCNGDTASSAINTCNDLDCVSFLARNGQTGRILVDQPPIWTENEAGLQTWGGSADNPGAWFWARSAANHSYSVMRWFSRGGSFMNYYMFAGGAHYGPTSGASIIQAYSTDAQICSDSLPHEPKFSHFTSMHAAIAAGAEIMLSSRVPNARIVYDTTGTFTASWYEFNSTAGCLAFLENGNSSIDLKFEIMGKSITVPFESSSLLNCTNGDLVELFNSAKVSDPAQHRVLKPAASSSSFHNFSYWEEPKESMSWWEYGFESVISHSPPEQNSLTKAQTQFVIYARNISVQSLMHHERRDRRDTVDSAFIAVDITASRAVSMSVFLNGQFVGSASDFNHPLEDPISLHINGTVALDSPSMESDWVELEIVSFSLGNCNKMASRSGGKIKGIVGNVTLNSHPITLGHWNTRIGISTISSLVERPWRPFDEVMRAGVWLRADFYTPDTHLSSSQFLLNLTGLSLGLVYVNDFPVARYCLELANDGSGQASQSLYVMPRSILAAPGLPNQFLAYEAGRGSSVSMVSIAIADMEKGPPPHFPESIRRNQPCRF